MNDHDQQDQRRLKVRARGAAAAAAAVALAAAALALAAGCASDKSQQAAAVAPGLDAPGFQTLWRADLRLAKDETVSSFRLTGDEVHVLTSANAAHALKRSSGELEYFNAVTSPGTILRQPTVMKDYVVYPAAYSLEVYNRTGRFLKSMKFEHSFTSEGAGTDRMLYIGTDESGGRLAAIDVTKDIVPTDWTALTFGLVSGRPALVQKAVYVASQDGKVYAVDADRTPLWQTDDASFHTSGPIYADVAADESAVYVASSGGRLYCLERGSGRLRWQYFADASLTATPAVTADSVYEVVPGRGVVALDKTKPMQLDPADRKTVEQSTRSPRWNVTGTRQFLAEDDANVYLLGDTGYTVVVVDKASGRERFRSSRPGLTLWSPNPAKDGVCFGASPSGTMFAMKPVRQ